MTDNIITSRVESGLGATFVVLLIAFLAGVLFIAIKNFDSDTIVLDSSNAQLVSMSSTERQLITAWIQNNNIQIPPGKGYHYVEQQYPDKPWLKDSSI